MYHPGELFGASRARRHGETLAITWLQVPEDPLFQFAASDVLVHFADANLALVERRVCGILSSFEMVSCTQQGDNLLGLRYGDPEDYGFLAAVEFYKTRGTSSFLGVRRLGGDLVAFRAFALYFAELVAREVPGSRRA